MNSGVELLYSQSAFCLVHQRLCWSKIDVTWATVFTKKSEEQILSSHSTLRLVVALQPACDQSVCLGRCPLRQSAVSVIIARVARELILRVQG